jgi:ribonuclease D
MPISNTEYIDSESLLGAACEACAKSSFLAIDTEFERTNTYFAHPALIQFYAGRSIYLLDPLTIEDLSPFSNLIHSDSSHIIMHAASEDLGLLKQMTGRSLANLFDTQIAAGFCGFDNSLGYHRLVDELLNVQINKDQTRSNWLRRPLSSAQLKYAALDVYYLPDMQDWLFNRLESLDRHDWLREEIQTFIHQVEVSEVERDYLKLSKNLPDDGEFRSRLMHLCEWRDSNARDRNVPRRQLLEDATMLAITGHSPINVQSLDELLQQLRPARRVKPSDIDSICNYLIATPERDLPPAVQTLKDYRQTIKSMQDIVRKCATRLELPPAVLASKRMLENFISHVHIAQAEDLPKEFCGWRREFLATPLLECLKHA